MDSGPNEPASVRALYGFVPLLDSAPTSQVGLERDCIVVLRIVGGKEQRNPAATHCTAECRNCPIFRIELASVAAAELDPPCRIVIEPAAER